MLFEGELLVLTPQQRSDLEEIARSQLLPAGFVCSDGTPSPK
jgi:hypothetical protein